MLTDFDDPVALGVSLDISDPVLADHIKQVLINLAVDMGMNGVICVNTSDEPPRNQGESVGNIALYVAPINRLPHQVEKEFKSVVAMTNECVSENKYFFYVTDSYSEADNYRIGKCFKLAERDFDGELFFCGFHVPVPEWDDCESYGFASVEEFEQKIREHVLG